jgi:hypothetical protein
LFSREDEIEHLRLLLAQLRRLRFGRKSEKLELLIVQLKLADGQMTVGVLAR